jgi:hypothetical protein
MGRLVWLIHHANVEEERFGSLLCQPCFIRSIERHAHRNGFLEAMHNVVVSPNRVAKVLLSVMGILVVMSLLTTFSLELKFAGTEFQVCKSMVRLFSLDGESNIPQWFSSCLLLSCSVFVGIVAAVHRQKKYARHWAILSLAFLYFSVDEAAQIHEMSIKPLRAMFHFSGYLYFGWVVPASILVLIFGISYLRFLASLPRLTRIAFVVAGIIYVGGAIGVESISASYISTTGDQTVAYRLLMTLEETFEMLGLIILIRGILQYMAWYFEGNLLIEIDKA